MGISKQIVIFGAGPSGLFCAEQVAQRCPDYKVIVIEAKRYVGRKFLVAGKSGLNLTNDEAMPAFLNHYTGPKERWRSMLADFDNHALRLWAEQLGFETFVSSGKKVFPRPMKSAPLLRAWMKRLDELGVEFRFNHKLSNLTRSGNNWQVDFENKDTPALEFQIGILAMGGASWPQTGSDASWIHTLEELEVNIVPFSPANCGWEIDWPQPIRDDLAGQPLKNVELKTSIDNHSHSGELTITEYGLEGGPIYHLGPALQQQDLPIDIEIDLKPSLTLEQIETRLAQVKRNYIREAKRRCKLSETAAGLLKHLPNLGPWKSGQQLAQAIKSCPLSLVAHRPIAEAISSAGGIDWAELDENLMIRKAPNLYAVGEMINWQAPTGGFLLQGCFATAYAASKGL